MRVDRKTVGDGMNAIILIVGTAFYTLAIQFCLKLDFKIKYNVLAELRKRKPQYIDWQV